MKRGLILSKAERFEGKIVNPQIKDLGPHYEVYDPDSDNTVIVKKRHIGDRDLRKGVESAENDL